MSKRSICPNTEGRCFAAILILVLAGGVGAQETGCQPVEYVDGLWQIRRIVHTEGRQIALLARERGAHYPAVNRRDEPGYVAWIARQRRGPDEIRIARMFGHNIEKTAREVSLVSPGGSSLSGSMPVRIRELVWSPKGSRLLVSSTHRGRHTVRVLDVTADVNQVEELERLDDGVWRSDFTFIDEQELAFKRRTAEGGEGLVIRRLGQDRVKYVVAGDVHDLSYSKASDSLFYRKYDGKSDVGLYLWRLGGSAETTLLNAPDSSQAFPRPPDTDGFAELLAFVSNYGGKVTDLPGRDDQRRRWRIYVESTERLKRVESSRSYQDLKPKSGRLLEDHEYQDLELQKRNVLIWHGSSIYSQPQDSDSQIIELNPTGGEKAVWCVPETMPILIPQKGPVELRHPAIESFDVFTSSGETDETYVVASLRVTVNNADQLTTLLVFLLGR